jgi:hypothetical protein
MKRGSCQMLIVDRRIVILGRTWRSKWWTIKCTCRPYKRRADGTCEHERLILSQVRPELANRVRIEMDE